MKITNQLRSRFVKDMDIPIQVIQDPYFDYYLSLYDYQFHTREKWDEFLICLDSFESEGAFFAGEKKFTDDIIAHISLKEEFKDFTKMPMDKFTNVIPLKKDTIYSDANVGKNFTSIDLIKANFQSLKYINSNIVDNFNTYEEFAKQFTNISHFIKSKKVRQVIFGNLCPQRQQTVQKYLMGEVQKSLIANGIDNEMIIASSTDEIVINGTYGDIKFIPENINCKINHFTIRKYGTEKFSFFTKFSNGFDKIKGVNSAYMPEVIKYQMGLPAVDKDRLFYNDGRLCQFQDSLF